VDGQSTMKAVGSVAIIIAMLAVACFTGLGIYLSM
jgi:hypothetical protein